LSILSYFRAAFQFCGYFSKYQSYNPGYLDDHAHQDLLNAFKYIRDIPEVPVSTTGAKKKAKGKRKVSEHAHDHSFKNLEVLKEIYSSNNIDMTGEINEVQGGKKALKDFRSIRAAFLGSHPDSKGSGEAFPLPTGP